MKQPAVFRHAFDAIGASPALRAHVLTELGSPDRHWHGLLHHALMLRAIARARPAGTERRRLIWAVLFHDIVYDGTRVDNEEASAAVARHWLGDDADDVVPLILATKHHRLDTDRVTQTLLEADLAVLWTTSTRLYNFYATGIRREYAHVPDAAYRPGRAAVLDRLEAAIASVLEPGDRACLTRNLAGERAALADGRFDLDQAGGAASASA